MSAPPAFSYVPAPHERGYYGALFQAADTERTGLIGGAQAVQFFTRSKVPISILKQIWVASDQPPTNALDPRKFAVAVRLIQLEQNSVKPGAAGPNLTNVPPNIRPVIFDGIPPPPMPPQQQGPLHGPAGTGGMAPQPPMRPPAMSSGGSVAGSVTSMSQHPSMAQYQQLAVQDPYTLTPAEQARYEQIFPEYCKQEPGFMHGQEAVGLFGKSGLPQNQLATIWNMVDVPVDNKLDSLEFAMAMHLIVCVSKKRLPLPTALPISFKQLKQQQQQQRINPSASMDESMQRPPTHGFSDRSLASVGPGMPSPGRPQPRVRVGSAMMSGGGGIGVGGGGMDGIPSPVGHHLPSAVGQDVDGAGNRMGGLSGITGPPPLQSGGGVSISDAFEGLDGGGDTGSISSYGASNQQVPSSVHMTSSFGHHHRVATVETVPEDDPVVHNISQPAERPRTTEELASSYNMGEAKDELNKLRGILQKLQAENISLKAKLGVMGDEEKDVQKELSATVTEISKLSNELTTVRAQMLASKSRLLEAAAELKSAKEKKGVISDLLTEVSVTKKAIDEAHAGIESANQTVNKAVAPPPLPVPMTEADLFGDWGDDVGSKAPPTAMTSAEVPVTRAAGHQMSEAQSHESQPQEQPEEENDSYPTFSYAQPPPPQPGMYNGGGYGGHNRTLSGFGEVMGGNLDLSRLAAGTDEALKNVSSYDAISHIPSVKELEILKSKSKEADEVAASAEESRRQLVAQMEELRRVADEAESKARDSQAKPQKKKGLFKGGQVKRDTKEIQKLAMDASEKKDALLQVQSQVKDAESLASATKAEAEKLRKEAEDAEMKATMAASMQQSAPPGHTQQNGNGYSFANSEPTGKFPPSHGGFAGPTLGFNSNIMGGGGGAIPTPSAAMASGGLNIPDPSGDDDPYSNPFG